MAVHDIRRQLPLINRGESETFYEHQEYPKMMLMLCDKAYLDAWLERNKFEDERGRVSYRGGRPRVGSPVPMLDDDFKGILVNDADEETEFRAEHPEALTLRGGLSVDQAELSRLEQENRTKDAELVELRAKFAAMGEGQKAAPAEAKKEEPSSVNKMVSNGGPLKLPKDLK